MSWSIGRKDWSLWPHPIQYLLHQSTSLGGICGQMGVDCPEFLTLEYLS